MEKGMIVVGYRSIGKTKLAHSGIGRYIDLDREIYYRMFKDSFGNGYKKYLRLAEEFAGQGYVVFVGFEYDGLCSDILKGFNCNIGAIVPDLTLEKDWVYRDKMRFFDTEKREHYEIWQESKKRFRRDVDYAKAIFQNNIYLIDDMNYNLDYVVKLLQDKVNKNKLNALSDSETNI